MIQKSRKVFIRHKPNMNAFTNINKETLRKGSYSRYIGSFITKGGGPGRGLDYEEEKIYLPMILGLSAQSPDWERATRNYWNNIRKAVPDTERGLELEIGFTYESEEQMKLGEVSNEINIDACKNRQKYGRPINPEHYVLYRYCLIYPDVASNVQSIHKSIRIRFYIFTQEAENNIKYKRLELRKLAQQRLAELWGERQLINDILLVYERFDITDPVEQDLILDSLVQEDPQKFLDIANDPQLTMKSFVQSCLREGALTRIGNTDGIKCDGQIIGYNIEEAVASLLSQRFAAMYQRLQVRMKVSPATIERINRNYLGSNNELKPLPVLTEEEKALEALKNINEGGNPPYREMLDNVNGLTGGAKVVVDSPRPFEPINPK